MSPTDPTKTDLPPTTDERDRTPKPSGNDTVPSTVVDEVRKFADFLTDRPTRIGPYHVLEHLGGGGMGEVYKAERRSPMRQIVAVKVIKLGFDTREVIARFESERQALARMDHPHIAKVLDAGATDTGRPWFAMEYVAGQPITKFADANKLTIRERLLLFAQVCDAIAHAHTKAIIHRDIKEKNVMACLRDGKPFAKVIDFGIAKALTGDRLTDATFNTEHGMAIGTYDSMSPEQAEGSPDIDTRTDVYSLGVLLYELLTGAKPFDHETLAKAASAEVRRIICEMEPPRPSTRLTKLGASATRVAALRREQLDHLAKELRGELEHIPLKCMRKERDRRYESVQQISQDIQNYLNHRPLLAAPESRVYRVRKYLRRNKGPVLAGSAIVLLLVGGAVGMTVMHLRAERAEHEREEARLRAEAEREQHIREQRDKELIVEALKIEQIGSASNLAAKLRELGKLDDAVRYQRSAAEDATQKLGENHPGTLASLNNLAMLLKEQGHLEEAAELYADVLERRRRLFGVDNEATINSMSNLGALRISQRKLNDAEPLLREALERGSSVLGVEHPSTMFAMHNYGTLLAFAGRLEDAESRLTETLRLRRRVLGNDHPDTLSTMSNLGIVLRRQGSERYAQAEATLVDCLNRQRTQLGSEHPDTLMSMFNLGLLRKSQKKFDEAQALLLDTLESRERSLGAGHPDTLGTLYNLALAFHDEGQFAEALAHFKRLRDGDLHQVPEGASAVYRSGYGVALAAAGQLDQAEPLLRQSYGELTKLVSPDHQARIAVVRALADLYDKTNRPELASERRAELERLEAAARPATGPT
jgi:serine/threonine protein kinase